MKRCSRCGELKPENEFHKDKTHKDGLTSVCKVCRKQTNTSWREKNHDAYVLYHRDRLKQGQDYINSLKTPCARCGESRSYLIQFHHIEPSTKSFVIGSLGVFKNKSQIENEVKKCICLCSNCHIEYHWFYGKHPSKPIDSLTEYLGRNPYDV